ncbi:hypothetical protein [Micromonospora rifamycinica]|uniref:Uncharacterized protein n=1 Tax=Micromonospora rifamycinica TaxID=291594 RepID=A0A109IJ01_9ACTN|nr:hypothetical protein [Micromonospora rifamycinica]KWV31406.1 hypothetical protein AWV63_17810 [Micromonospora rifamycinica]SCG78401.1 hypothetical protein GA0070623_4394 [Micromonospora rifamycinica]
MRRLTEETVLAVGRLTLAATELEYLLASIGTGQAEGGDLPTIFTGPGEPVQVARRAAHLAPPAHRAEFVGLVEAAATYLVQGRTAVRALWLDGNRVDAATFDEIAGLVLRCRDRLQALHDDLTHPASAPPRTR